MALVLWSPPSPTIPASFYGSSPATHLRIAFFHNTRTIFTWILTSSHSDQSPTCTSLAKQFHSHLQTAHFDHSIGHHSPRSLNDIIDQLNSQTDVATYASLLRLCTFEKALSQGERVHQHMIRHGCPDDRFLNNLLVQMYGKCGSLQQASAVFDNMAYRNSYSWNIMLAACAQNGSLDCARIVFAEMPQKDVVSWSAMITTWAKNGYSKEAIELFDQMQAEGLKPNNITFISILDACASIADIEEGRRIHASVVSYGWESDVFVGNSLVNLYGKCRSLHDARAVFAEMTQRDVVLWSAMIAACAQNMDGEGALQLLNQMQAESMTPDEVTFACVLDACTGMAALEEGQEIHASVVENGWESDVVVGTALVNMYGKCGNLDDARAVFAEMPQRNVISWNTMIASCTQNGHAKRALQMFGQMQAEGLKPNNITFVCVVDACASTAALEEGLGIHDCVVDSGWEQDVTVGNALVNMYGKCRSLDDARAVFAEMPRWDVVSWSTMMAACTQNGHGKEALQLLDQMQAKGFEPNKIAFISVLDACASVAALKDGQESHACVIGNAWESDVVMANALINMYGKCWSLDDARAVFTEMPIRNVISWNTIITVCAQNDQGNEALRLFGQMQFEDFEPDESTLICILDACATMAALEKGRHVHDNVVGNGWESEVIVGNTLVNMYGKCESMDDARAVFVDMPQRNLVSWNAMIAVCAQNGHSKEALQLFHQMQGEGFQPDEITFICVLDACADVAAIKEGQEIHAAIVDKMWESHAFVGNGLVNMYGKCGRLNDARAVFAEMPQWDVMLWSAMIAACAQNGYGKEALQLFNQMQAEGVEPDVITVTSVLDACSTSAALEKGREIHISVAMNGWDSDIVLWTALISMYGRCGSIDDARAVFEEMPKRNVVSWNAMMTACPENGHGKEALQVFGQMQAESIAPDGVTFLCVLDACASVAALEKGQEIHASVTANGWECDILGTALIKMYGKCGSLDDARAVFIERAWDNVALWNAMISACAQNGHGQEAIQLFDQMESKSIKPNEITFISLLTACSHMGMVDNGSQYLTSMFQDYGISPSVDHYMCVIDLFGRAGQLDKAEQLISGMPFKPASSAWSSLLSSCRIHGDVERGLQAANHVLDIDKTDASPYVLLANIRAAADS